MTPNEITGDLYLPLGIQLEAYWWQHHYEQTNGMATWHGVEVKRVRKVKGRDLFGA